MQTLIVFALVGFGAQRVCTSSRSELNSPWQAAGLVVEARLVREPEPPEKTPQAYLLARKPG
jgi:hypothetical protein